MAQLGHDGLVVKRFACAAGPNGLAIGPDGSAYVMSDGGLTFKDQDGDRGPVGLPADYVGGVIERLDIESGSITTLYEEVDDHHIDVLNDIIFNAEGFAYVADTVHGKIYYFDPVGSKIRTVYEGLEAPNGMGLSPSGQDIFVSETYSGTIWRIPVTAPGELGEKVMHWTNERAYGFDGLSVDAEGCVCAASLGPSGITVISAKGEKIGFVELPQTDGFVTNIIVGARTAAMPISVRQGGVRYTGCVGRTRGSKYTLQAR